nr:ATP-binding cassette domain-containing protein [Arenimonas sp.]
MSHAINVTNLSKRVQLPNSELCILDDVSCTMDKGQTLAIVGASGSGKSTL